MSEANVRAGLATAAKLGREHYVQAGRKRGRRAWRALQRFVCEQCGSEFHRKVMPSHPTYRFCGIPCHLAFQRDRRRKLPKDPQECRALLHDLYVTQRMTTVEIAAQFGMEHRSVIHAMERCGIPRRPVGQSRHLTCCEEDCSLPVHKVKHKTNGSWYGKRCRLHWIIFRMAVNQRYNDKHLGKDDEAWLRRLRQLLARVRRLNREVSQSLKPGSEPATTSPDACPR